MIFQYEKQEVLCSSKTSRKDYSVDILEVSNPNNKQTGSSPKPNMLNSCTKCASPHLLEFTAALLTQISI